MTPKKYGRALPYRRECPEHPEMGAMSLLTLREHYRDKHFDKRGG